ncbi:hypothetical protein LY76DRAFT_539593 [Colletotrichum caudatum]|nr:hypothetical protein LY76DRAFT_539593 [Colletotrichum caudatum]
MTGCPAPMAAVRLTTSSSPGVRAAAAAAASPRTSQLWPSATANAATARISVPDASAAVAPTPPFVLTRDGTRHRETPNRYFNPSDTVLSGNGGSPGKKPGDENKANLGRTLRILQDHLPTVLQSPLPQEILAPNISLHLFPTTHPHLPTVSGRVAYTAALWTSPIAWNRLPLVGNVRLSIVSERVTKQPLRFAPLRPGAIPEQLVVRWCAAPGRKNGSATAGGAASSTTTTTTTTTSTNKTTMTEEAGTRGEAAAAAAAATTGSGDTAFTGLFVFQFDAEGRILSHTIETVQEGGDWERGVGAKVVGLTDWLLGGMRRQGDSPSPAFEGLGRKG